MAAGIACADQTGIVAVGNAVVAGAVKAFGGDSSPARDMPEFHNRRTRVRCLLGHQIGERSNSWVMQVAEAENNGVVVCNDNALCEVNEWLGEWGTAGRVNQCMRLRVAVLW